MNFELLQLAANVIIGLAAFGAAGCSYLNRHAIKEVHLSLNGRLDELLKSTADHAFIQGEVAAAARAVSSSIEPSTDTGDDPSKA